MDGEEKPEGLEPWQKEDNWQQIAIALAVAAPVLLLFVVPWVLAAPKETGILTRVQIVSPFGVLYVAALTFVTAIWRGLITRRQADQQQQQVANIARQIASADENNLAQLLQSGAELLADEKPAHVSAGIATLQAVAVAENDRFAVPAMDLLIGFIEQNSDKGHGTEEVTAAINAVNATFRLTGRESRRAASFRFLPKTKEEADYRAAWQAISGCRLVTYRGGVCRQWMFDPEEIRPGKSRFMDVRFEGILGLDVANNNFLSCEFLMCKIRSVSVPDLLNNIFENCDFTSAEIVVPDRWLLRHERDLRFGNSAFFIAGLPPVLMQDGVRVPEQPDWEKLLEPRGG